MRIGTKSIQLLRWVVERILRWLSKCRAILVRYEKKACNYLGFIKLACALHRVFDDLFEEPIGKLLLRNRRIKLITFNPKQEVIKQWIAPS